MHHIVQNYAIALAAWVVFGGASACNVVTAEQDKRASENSDAQETDPSGATVPVDVTGGFLVGVGPAGEETPAGFVQPHEEAFGVGLFERAAALAGAGERKVGGMLKNLVVVVTLTNGLVSAPAIVPAGATSRWHAFFKIERTVVALIASVKVTVVANDKPFSSTTDSYAYVPPTDVVAASVTLGVYESPPGEDQMKDGGLGTVNGGATTGEGAGGATGTAVGGVTTGEATGSATGGDTTTTGGTTTGGDTGGPTGGTTTGSTTTGGMTGNMGPNLDPSKQYVFVTSMTTKPGADFDGTADTSPERFDSKADATEICASAAAAANLPRTWVAVISETGSNASTAVVTSNLHTVDGTQVFVGTSFYSPSSSPVAALTTETGAAPGSLAYWTGSMSNGALSAGISCTDWTSDSSGQSGVLGYWSTPSPTHVSASAMACSGSYRLLCITTP